LQVPLYIIASYLPADNDIGSYRETISELETYVTHYSTLGHVILGGDFNAQIQNRATGSLSISKSRALCEFTKNLSLLPVNYTPLAEGAAYSFTLHENMLDYISINEDILQNITKFKILEESEIQTSDHLPLIMSLVSTCNSKTNEQNHTYSHVTAWHKATYQHTLAYQNRL